MKFPSRSALPPLDSTARLPLLLAAALSAALLFQMLVIDDVTLPDAGPTRGGTGGIAPLPMMATGAGGGAIVARSMFSPGASRTAPGAAVATDPLGGVSIAGSMRIGRSLYAVVQRPGAPAAYVRPGGRIGGWRLDAITPTDAVLRRGGERLRVPFGARGPIGGGAVAEESE